MSTANNRRVARAEWRRRWRFQSTVQQNAQEEKPHSDLTRCEPSCSTNRPGRNRTCNPRFWSALPATPALQRLLIFKNLALSEQRRRRWTTPALALILALKTIRPTRRRQLFIAPISARIAPSPIRPPANVTRAFAFRERGLATQRSTERREKHALLVDRGCSHVHHTDLSLGTPQ